MTRKVLLYGATGYSGGLLADEANRREANPGTFRMILAARNRNDLAKVAKEKGMEWRAFGLQHVDEVARHLRGVDVVLNAAGPFAWTATTLAQAARKAECHYVDINGEVDVYKRLDDRAFEARQLGLALVSGAAATAGTSDIMLDAALRTLEPGSELGTIRIAHSRIPDFSAGSALSAARQFREQVVTVRRGVERENGRWEPASVLWHEPIGRLEQSFDLGIEVDIGKDRRRTPLIASAANLVDTLAAHTTVKRHHMTAQAIESYVETGPLGRIGYQLGGVLAMFTAFPVVRNVARASLATIPPPTTHEPMPHVVVLQIDDPCRKRLIDWRLQTPDVYQWTAQIAIAVTSKLCTGGTSQGKASPEETSPAGDITGWVTPSQVLDFGEAELRNRGSDALRGSQLHDLPMP